jgi:uncharacterized repeat protein (TIGR02543 family)
MTLYARWTAVPYNLSFNSAGGTVQAMRKVSYGSPLGTLPTPKRSGFAFQGWYNSSGAKVSSSTVMTGNLVLTARWKSTNNSLSGLKVSTGKLSPKFSSSRTSYTLSIARSNSSVKITPSKANSKAVVQFKSGSKWKTASSYTAKPARGKSVKVQFRVIAESGAVKNYTVTVKRAK